MTTWVWQDLCRPLTVDELAKRAEEEVRARLAWDEKHRPENIKELPLSAVPKSYRHFLPKEGG